PPLLLDFAVTGVAAPTDHRRLVAPDRKRQQPARPAQARKALVLDEPFSLLELGAKQLGIAEIAVPGFWSRLYFENHGEHVLPLRWRAEDVSARLETSLGHR